MSQDKSPMTPEQRQEAFRQLFRSLPGKNIQRIRLVCSILHLRENTIRLYLCKPPVRTIPERSLKILEQALIGNVSE